LAGVSLLRMFLQHHVLLPLPLPLSFLKQPLPIIRVRLLLVPIFLHPPHFLVHLLLLLLLVCLILPHNSWEGSRASSRVCQLTPLCCCSPVFHAGFPTSTAATRTPTRPREQSFNLFHQFCLLHPDGL